MKTAPPKRQPVHVGLDECGVGAAPPGAPQHGVRQVDRDQPGLRGEFPQAGDERPGAAADSRIACAAPSSAAKVDIRPRSI
jgi:hypothetical protein